MDKDTRDAIWTTNDCKSYAGSQGLITIMYLVEKSTISRIVQNVNFIFLLSFLITNFVSFMFILS